MKDRLLGYEKAIKLNNLKSYILQIPFDEIYSKKAKQYIKDFFIQNINLDAVFFATNYLAQNRLEVFKENNCNLLSNLGIIVFDENEMFKIYPTSISCVSQPLYEISSKLMELMLPLLNAKDVTKITQKIILKSEIILRESSLKK